MVILQIQFDGADYDYDDVGGNDIIVRGSKCGMNFGDIAKIVEPYSENPLIVVERPFGFNALRHIMFYWNEYRGGNLDDSTG